jgi:hypothetical protein
MNKTNAIRLASLASHRNQCPGREWVFDRGDHPSTVPGDFPPTEAAARTIPLALFAFAAIYKRAAPALPVNC